MKMNKRTEERKKGKKGETKGIKRLRRRQLLILVLFGAFVLQAVSLVWVSTHQQDQQLENGDIETPFIIQSEDKDFHKGNSKINNGNTKNYPPSIEIGDEYDKTMIGRTKIVGFCNYRFRQVGIHWFHRMTRLGYDTHVLVATESTMVDFLKTQRGVRYQIELQHDEENINERKGMTKDRKRLDRKQKEHLRKRHFRSLMASRWKFLLSQLKLGIHILLTDVDNIFTRFIDMEEEFANRYYPYNTTIINTYNSSSAEASQVASTNIDIFHAYATKFPLGVYNKQRFVVCSGMSWWRGNSPRSIHMAEIMHRTCGVQCDDQTVLNRLLIDEVSVQMTWEWPDHVKKSRLVDPTDQRFDGILTRGMVGRSNITQHIAKIWDRDFAFRGPLEFSSDENTNLTDTISSGSGSGGSKNNQQGSSSLLSSLPCPITNPTSRSNNWVAMPIVRVYSPAEAIQAKLDSFHQWDTLCGIELDQTATTATHEVS